MTTYYDQDQTTRSSDSVPRARRREPRAYSEFDYDDDYDAIPPAYRRVRGPQRYDSVSKAGASVSKAAIVAGLLGVLGVGAGLGVVIMNSIRSTPTQPAVVMVPDNTGAPTVLPPAQPAPATALAPAPAPAPAASGPKVSSVPRQPSVTNIVVPPSNNGGSARKPAPSPTPAPASGPAPASSAPQSAGVGPTIVLPQLPEIVLTTPGGGTGGSTGGGTGGTTGGSTDGTTGGKPDGNTQKSDTSGLPDVSTHPIDPSKVVPNRVPDVSTHPIDPSKIVPDRVPDVSTHPIDPSKIVPSGGGNTSPSDGGGQNAQPDFDTAVSNALCQLYHNC